MSKYFYIRDNQEKEIEIDLENFNNKNETRDSKISDSILNGNHDGIEIYNIATVSDKEINRRLYSREALIDTVEKKMWLTKFNKPILKNHDSYCEPVGRVIDSFYLTHDTKTVMCKSSKSELPQEVIDAFDSKKLFNEGTGSVILKLKVDWNTYDKISSGIYLTTSQGAITDSRTCSICGSDITKCDHMPGQMYDNKKCLIVTGKIIPVENSIVNEPANDSSLFVLFDTETKEIKDSLNNKNKDSKIEESEKIKDNQRNLKSEVIDKMPGQKLEKYMKILKDQQQKKIESFFGVKDNLSTILDSFELEDMDKLIDLTDCLLELGQTKINDKIAELQLVIDSKIEEIKNLTDKVDELEIKLTDLNNISTEEPVEEPVIQEPVVEEPVTKDEKEKVEEPVVPEPEVKDIKEENEKEKVEDLEEKTIESKMEKITDNFTTFKLKNKSVITNTEIVNDYFKNQKNILNTF